MINWKVRFKNWKWVSGFISQIMIIVQLALVGLNTVGVTHFKLTEDVQAWVLMIANAIFVALSMLGVVQDPTTSGYGDSEQAKTYSEPK